MSFVGTWHWSANAITKHNTAFMLSLFAIAFAELQATLALVKYMVVQFRLRCRGR